MSNKDPYRSKLAQTDAARSRAGTNRQERFFKPLEKGFLKIDERQLIQHLIFAKELAAKIKYYNTENKLDGTWERFFTTDRLIILAEIVDADLVDLEDSFTDFIKNAEESRLKDDIIGKLNEVVSFILAVADQISAWYQNLKSITDYQSELVEELNDAIQSLSVSMKDLKSFHFGDETAYKRTFGPSFKTLRDEFGWELPQDDDDQERQKPITVDILNWKENKTKGIPVETIISNTIAYLQPVYNQFFKTITFLQHIANRYFLESLGMQNNEPGMTLLVAFLKLYEYPQKALNANTQKHFDFYFREVLQQHRAEPGLGRAR